MKPSLGDVFEFLALLCAGVFVGLTWGASFSLIVAAVGLFYLAQGFSQPLSKPGRPKLRRRRKRDSS